MAASKLFGRILVGVDSEGLAANAVVRGSTLARALGAKLDLVHAVEVPPSLWPGISQKELAGIHATALTIARKRTLECLSEALRDAGIDEVLGDLLRVCPGHPAKVILERADESQADLILLGPHAKQSLLDFGSTARAVLARTNVPVLTQVGPTVPVKNILVPIDFSEHSRSALQSALALATHLDASLRVLHCHAPCDFAYSNAADAIPGPTYVVDHERRASQEELARWMEEFEWGSVHAESTFVEERAETGILREGEDCDMIVMGTHGRTGLARFLIGSVAYAVLKHSDRPVLVVPSPNRAWQLGEGETEGAKRTQVEPSTSVG